MVVSKEVNSMTKRLVIPSSFALIERTMAKCNGFILGIKDFSVNMPINFSLEELECICNLCNQYRKELVIAVNKNIHNEELKELECLLKNLSTMKITGIMYYDIAIVNLNKKLDLNLNLIWSQEHLTTNYSTCNFWSSFGVTGVYLSSDITLEEIIEIKNHVSMKVFVNVLGYLPMFASRRHLVRNYLKTFSLSAEKGLYKICKEGKDYTIVDNDLGSFVYSNNILNGIDEYLRLRENKIDYVILNSFQIDDDSFTKIVELFAEVDITNVEQYSKIIGEMCPNWDKGFLYKETVYKVKNNE